MGRRRLPVYGILSLALAVAAAACGGGDTASFEKCGNGVLDHGEQCDDGNLVDEDACLSTCEVNVCGDTFLNVGVEQCDALTGRTTCVDLGFAGGTLACSASCTFDTTGCGGVSPPTPTPDATPSGSVGTPTATSATPAETAGSPAVTPMPGGGNICQAGQQVVVTASLDKAYAAFAMTLAYPASVNIPGSGASVGSRVIFDVSGGFNTASDDDDIGGDGVDDTLHASFVSNVSSAPGPVFTVTFDCLAGEVKPSASDFTCTVVSASTPDAETITDEVCSLSVQ